MFQKFSERPVADVQAEPDGLHTPVRCTSCGIYAASPHGSEVECIKALRSEIERLVTILHPMRQIA